MKHEMPEINLSTLKAVLTAEEYAIVEKITITRGGRTTLRASKPNVARTDLRPSGFFIRGREDMVPYPTEETGSVAFVWRWVAFFISPVHQHQCMPVMDLCDLPWRATSEERRELSEKLTKLADKVVNTVPLGKQPGTIRWAKALGYLG